MSTFARIGREYVAQVAAFMVALADRLIIPAVFLRALGVASFSAWSVVIAASGFVVALEFGVTRYFTNRLIALVERGDQAEAERSYRVGLTLLVGFAVFSLVAIAVGFGLLVKGVGDPQLDRQLPLLAIPVTLASALLQILGLRQALYRAHRQFAAETWIRLAGDTARIATVAIGAAAGLGLSGVCWLWLAATVGFIVLPVTLDTRRRYPGFGDRFALPRASHDAEVVRLAPGLWLQMVFSTLFATVPVMVIGALTAAPALIAQFVLMRTLANFVRQILQMFANVFGIELARRQARGDAAGYVQTFHETNRFLTVQTAVAFAVLYALAQPLFTLWTGKAALYDRDLLVLAILPPLIFPTMMLTIEALAYANRPWPLVAARLVQLAITVLCFAITPGLAPGLRMMLALFAGEVLGLGPYLVVAARQLDPAIGFGHALVLPLLGAVAAAGTLGLVELAWSAPIASEFLRLALALAAGGVALVLASALFGVSPARRKAIAALGVARLRRTLP